ncbi:MAG: hypothetical protein ABIL76_00850 [candidate division WOR-3 bacterium]
MKIAIIGYGDDDIVFKMLKNLTFERTFAFSIDKKSKFNEYARRLGFNVIIINPKFLNWEEELKTAISDFNPNLILDFNFPYDFRNFEKLYKVYNFGEIVLIENKDKIVFIGDLMSFNKFFIVIT